MAMRGESILWTQVYEAELLSVLNVVPESLNSHLRKIRILRDCCDPDMRAHIHKRCDEAASMIKDFFGSFHAGVNVLPSNRGKNDFDFIMAGPLETAFLLDVVVTDNMTGTTNSTYRMPYERLMNILWDRGNLPQEEKASLQQRQADIAIFFGGQTYVICEDQSKNPSTVFIPVRKLLTDTALRLQEHGSGLMPALWNYFYSGMPVLRVTFAKERIFLQFLDPVSGYSSDSAVISPTLHGDGVWERSGNNSVRVRIPEPRNKLMPQHLTAWISFDFPDGLDGRDSFYR